MFNTLFAEVGAVIIVAGILSLLAYKLRQPLIIAYILTGIAVGPGLLGIAQSEDVFAAMSQIGIALLLFLVGLNLNWQAVRDVGKVALLGGIAQVVFTSLVGFVIGQALGFDAGTSAFMGVAFSFSSTIIIVKLLSDKEDLDRLYGRVAVGMLIVQDLIAMFLLLVVAALRDGGSLASVLTVSLAKGAIVIVVLALVSRFILRYVIRYAAQSQELLFLAAMGWCFGLATVLSFLGFGIEIGALLAGISLASSGFQHDIEAKIRSLRDFFLVIFFIVLGTHLTVDSFGGVWLPALIMSLYVLIGNPLIAMVIMRFLGYHPRSAFLTGTTVAQISEFSFILLSGGIAAGLVTQEVIPLATMVGLITIALSSYMIKYNERVYESCSFMFEWMVGEHHKGEKRREKAPDHILFGYHRMGREIFPALRELPGETLVIDFNPAVIQSLADDGTPCMYGDAASEDVLQFVRAEKAKLVVSTVPDMAVNIDLLDYLRQHHSRAVSVVTTKSAEDAQKCYTLGATFVIVPSVLGGQRFADFLKTRKTSKHSWATLGKRLLRHQQ